jgi:prepilin signal peptidase PulO-like enzyme (type II secretory pathway)
LGDSGQGDAGDLVGGLDEAGAVEADAGGLAAPYIWSTDLCKGPGDVKWAGVLGPYLGRLDWSALVIGTLLAFLAAGVALLVARLVGRRRSSLPMAPFMTFGALAAILATRISP